MNTVIQKGNIVRNPEVKVLPTGTYVAETAIAVTRKYKDKNGEKKEETSFFDIRAYGKRAEFFGEYVVKGSPVLIQGSLKQDRWETGEGNRSRVWIVVSSIQLLGSKKEASDMPPHSPEEDDDDIPF